MATYIVTRASEDYDKPDEVFTVVADHFYNDRGMVTFRDGSSTAIAAFDNVRSVIRKDAANKVTPVVSKARGRK